MVEEHVAKGDALLSVEHPVIGEFRSPAYPAHLSDTPGDASGPPPPLTGEHTEDILRESGLEPEEIRGLVGRGVVNGGLSDEGETNDG